MSTKMRNTLIVLVFTAVLASLAWAVLKNKLNSGSLEPDNTVWQKFIGRDTTVGLWPDVYANYFAYTYIKTSDDICLKIKGEFPNTRYMSFNVYNIRTKTTQGSIVDNQLVASLPFDIDSERTGDSYEVNILPKHLANANLPNKLLIEEDERMLLVVIRLYDFNVDDYGGADLPTVQAFEISDSEHEVAINLPTPINLRKYVKGPKIAEDIWYMYNAEELYMMDGPNGDDQYRKLPFFRVIGEGMIQNNDNLYLLSAVTKKPEEVYVMRFKAPSFVQHTDDIDSTDVRYWSVNIGSDQSYVYNAIKDEDCIIDEEGFVTVVMAEKDEQLESKVKALGFNYLEWNVSRQRAFIIYRNMLSRDGFEGHLLKVPPLKTKGSSSFDNFEAKKYIGDYAPVGYRLSVEDFMKEFK